MRIGLISDTHGLYRADITRALMGVTCILHAGDVGGGRVLQALRGIAPVHAVAGNVDDRQDPALVLRVDLEVEGRTIHVSHGHELGSPTPQKLLARYPADVIVYGHTHRSLIHRDGSRLVVNPGAAGPRRFDLLPSVAILTLVREATIDAEIIPLRE